MGCMCAAVKMRPGEVDLDDALVSRLVASQLPRWAGLPVRRLPSSGTENAMFRLGDDKVVRLPRHPEAVESVGHEQRWLPRLGPALPVATPEPLARGGPDDGFAWPWSVYRWLDGRNPVAGAVERPLSLAAELAAFVTALRTIDPRGCPPNGRGVPLAERDGPTRDALARLTGRIDVDAVTALWEEALRAPGHAAPPMWAHGDLSPGNVLVRDGRLTAVIDFGGVGVGDPAVDLIIAWNLLPASARGAFREAVGADDAEWARGRGWALSISLIQLPYYWDTNPPLAENSRHVIREILAEAGAAAAPPASGAYSPS
ncbi:aminoglycoside phosphotransferase family protein [Streptomyces hilarionis]|uniref:aminoglycoside phosphotransferase family protein n=1 Tax=Streptomyces hilarionis TaxID=2839954 RepID=UPI00211A4A8E|nr:aminoglycoside phosphotransferase family protein [Streptomyces hilarionis]MCQ9130383.1 aminoglycoside phosphotransferase family protein [Streptomyces hilarionis]